MHEIKTQERMYDGMNKGGMNEHSFGRNERHNYTHGYVQRIDDDDFLVVDAQILTVHLSIKHTNSTCYAINVSCFCYSERSLAFAILYRTEATLVDNTGKLQHYETCASLLFIDMIYIVYSNAITGSIAGAGDVSICDARLFTQSGTSGIIFNSSTDSLTTANQRKTPVCNQIASQSRIRRNPNHRR